MAEKLNSENLEISKEPMGSCETTVPRKRGRRTSRFAITSLIFALLGLLFFLIFVHSFVRLNPNHVPLRFLYVLFFTLSILLGVTALIIIALNHRKLKGCWFPVIAIFILAFVLLLLFTLPVSMRRHRRLVVRYNLRKLYQAMTEYSENNDGYLPTADRWCDLLMEQNENMSEDVFKYPHGKYGISIFAFNKNLDGLCLDDVPNDVILLFEHGRSLDPEERNDISWNLAGGHELLERKFGERQEFWVLLASGKPHVSMPSLRTLFDEQLRWKP